MFNTTKVISGNPNLQVPDHLNFGKFMLDRLRCFPDRIAICKGDTNEKLTYKELAQYSINLATSLIKLGIGIGDTVALGAETRIEIMPTALAVVFTGATYTPLDLDGGKSFHEHKIAITQPKYFICTNLFWDKYKDVLKTVGCIKYFITLDEATETCVPVKSLLTNDVDVNNFEPVKVDGERDVALILYSSGTTGMPKGIMLTHRNCILCSLPHHFTDPTIQTGLTLGVWFHNYDIFMTCKMLYNGMKNIFVSIKSSCALDLILKSIEDHKVNIAMLVPFIVVLLSKHDRISQYDVDSLKVIYSRSSPLHKTTIENIKKMFPKLQSVRQGYGLTECGEPASEAWGTMGSKPGSIGMVSPGVIMKIVEPETNEILGPNERGEIRVCGPFLMKGYIGTDPSTYLDEQGFFKTGDLGYYDEDKYFYIVDRLKDIIVYEGFKIPPLPLEATLLSHPNVREAAVVGKKVPIYGEVPTGFVVIEPGTDVTENELLDLVAAEVAPFMELRGGVRFLDELPKNPRGKILRRNLREMLNV